VKTIGWGIVGAAGIADRRTIPEGIVPSPGSRLVALMGPHEEKLIPIAKKYGICKCYTREEDLLRDPEVDAVYIATPNYLHRKQAVAAAEQGKHILCEKPFAINVRECRQIIASCKKNDVKLAVGFMMRFHVCHQLALKIVKERTLGNLVSGRVQFGCWYPDIAGAWRQIPEQGGGGSLMDLGIHGIDLLRMYLGDAVEVCAFNDTLSMHYTVEDSSLVAIKFKTRAYGIVDSFFNIPRPAARNGLELNGTKGSIVTERTIGQESTGRLRLEVLGQPIKEWPQPSTPPVNIYRAEVEDLVRAIREDSQPLNSGTEALKDQEIAMAAYKSSKTGRAISLQP